MDKPYSTRISGFYVLGLEERTSNAAESDPATAKIPILWGRFYGDNLAAQIPKRLDKGRPYGVYFDYEGDHGGAYSVLAGYQVRSLESAQPGMMGLSIPSGKYQVFTAKGAAEVPRAWANIWEYFAKAKAKRSYQYDFEVYEGEEKVSIYIGVK
jgi:predicted transcriptional regulator YdeE